MADYGVNINLRVKGQSGLDRLNAKVKELTKRWRPDINIQHAQKNAAHRAEADVYESINELRFYRDTIFAQSS